ncbi:putative mucin TcMUCII [Trypanosoma cruzi]|uniref:Mucin TcMUCII, putative n=2 Tax=Trypanosoma cruzi TaxID=5693 RepID=Q4DMQ3_TRYCC|nr:mucin TcMUCII, putative [Trypanosoma cruzi]EAN93805.1 mucin TcMUCII, putative [Trypanosoma cruzi]PWV21009.1 putative mucin TcMUCII [Trypanosoma cruzi]RNC41595.1 mucin TcMUCII [Trypanosoma cruzi]|eukprot:XP_815656.1 mucin TcMUCII [Trypanosoma cruzi strain CL Brener]
MMTCRLLCALLVLALCCCCPSVHAGDTDAKNEEESSQKNIISAPTPTPVREGEESGAGHADTAVNGSGSTDKEQQSSDAPNELQEKSTEGMTGAESGTSIPAKQGTKGEEGPAETAKTTATTTTTTKAPTTTTTTTTTEAPSTTTTEAPTTTTTRAPSRLREIDGSLSSSAWVCAPLVLAASALAYTTLG